MLVFEPLGMTNSFFTQDGGLQKRRRGASRHRPRRALRTVDLAMERCVESVAPAGAAWSTAEDMAKYLLLELRGGKTPSGEPLLSEQTLRSRWRGGIKINDKMDYGLGLLHSEEQGLDVIGHGGNNLRLYIRSVFSP